MKWVLRLFCNVLLPWLLFLATLAVSGTQCSQDRAHEKGHLNRRQALKKKQREAVLSRHELNSVVDQLDERTAATPTCARITCEGMCVRNMPDASNDSSECLADVYRRLEEEASPKMASNQEKKKRLEEEASSKTISNKTKKKQLEVETTQRSPHETDKSCKAKDSSKEKSSSLSLIDQGA